MNWFAGRKSRGMGEESGGPHCEPFELMVTLFYVLQTQRIARRGQTGGGATKSGKTTQPHGLALLRPFERDLQHDRFACFDCCGEEEQRGRT
jgi:hypothetical protein